jgi:hypothetical protein
MSKKVKDLHILIRLFLAIIIASIWILISFKYLRFEYHFNIFISFIVLIFIYNFFITKT